MTFERFLTKGYLDQPREVSLETLAKCNAACTFCPYPTLERIGTKMPDHLISRLIGEMAKFEHPFFFSPFKVNEPFLDKRLQSICQTFEADVPHGTLRLFSNGSPLTPANVEWVAGLKRLSHMWISLNEHVPDRYEKLMAIPFERTANNLDALHQLVASGDFTHPVVLSTVGSPNEPFKYYCWRRWPLFQTAVLKKDAWINYTEAQIKLVPDEPCWRWLELNVTAAGRVVYCCMTDGNSEEHYIGDLNKQTLLEVYNSPFWRERREKQLSRRKLAICGTCTY